MGMTIASDFEFKPLPDVANLEHFPFPAIFNPLGPLAQLPGSWAGTGFNQIWRPNHQLPGQPPNQDRFLELNLTQETLTFEVINGPIPNRGLLQPDINMFGVHYLQQISDANVKGAGLHLEPGIWVSIPKTTNPEEQPTVCRMASIPHGTTILAQGEAISVNGPPKFQPVDITPFVIGNPAKKIPFPESDLSKPAQFRSPPAQIKGITQAMVNNPNSVLEAAIAGQDIVHTEVLSISSVAAPPLTGGGTDNTSFLQGMATAGPNAQAAQVTAIFWIETVKGKNGQPDFLQLQYSQTVLLNFNGLSWPHVTVATLRLHTPVRVPVQRIDPLIPADLLKKVPQEQ